MLATFSNILPTLFLLAVCAFIILFVFFKRKENTKCPKCQLSNNVVNYENKKDSYYCRKCNHIFNISRKA